MPQQAPAAAYRPGATSQQAGGGGGKMGGTPTPVAHAHVRYAAAPLTTDREAGAHVTLSLAGTGAPAAHSMGGRGAGGPTRAR